MLFVDRRDAGRKLLHALRKYQDREEIVVLGLPRGGVVVAYEIAVGLHRPLDVICPRKIGAPTNPELAIGATTETGPVLFNQRLLSYFNLDPTTVQELVAEAQKESHRRLAVYRDNRPAQELKGKIVIVVDDGIATGATMKAAIQSVAAHKPKEIVVAVPVAPTSTLAEFTDLANHVVCLHSADDFQAVGQFYRYFDQTVDTEVISLLDDADKRQRLYFRKLERNASRISTNKK